MSGRDSGVSVMPMMSKRRQTNTQPNWDDPRVAWQRDYLLSLNLTMTPEQVQRRNERAFAEAEWGPG